MTTLETRIVELAQSTAQAIKQDRSTMGALASLQTDAKGNLVAALNELLARSAENKAAIGSTGGLSTTAKTNLVAAINEVLEKLNKIDLSAVIDDAAPAGVKHTYSIDKIIALIGAMRTDVMASISGGITDTTMDTLKEVADFLKGSAAGGLVDSLSQRVSVGSVQNFSPEQRKQARDNIGAAAAADLAALGSAIGSTDTDFAGAFNTALNA